MKEKTCPRCKKIFTIEAIPGQPKKFCSGKCRRNFNAKIYREKNRKIKPLTIKRCSICNIIFKAKHADKAFCSIKCMAANYRKKNKELILKYQKKKYPKYREKILSKQKEYRNTPEVKLHRKKLREKYKKDGSASRHRKKGYEKMKTNPSEYALFKIINNCRRRVRRSIKTHDVQKSNERKIELIGCTSLELKIHLEKQFQAGMTWENYGKYWHVDHIIPLSRFDITKRSERNRANHYTNLQPLEAKLNISLKDKKHLFLNIGTDL